MRWAGHVVRMGEDGGCIGSLWGNRREGDHWGDLVLHIGKMVAVCTYHIKGLL